MSDRREEMIGLASTYEDLHCSGIRLYQL